MSGYILYRGSRDQLNELCRAKDERIEKLEDSLRLVRLWMEGTYNPQGWIYPHGAREIRKMIEDQLKEK